MVSRKLKQIPIWAVANFFLIDSKKALAEKQPDDRIGRN